MWRRLVPPSLVLLAWLADGVRVAAAEGVSLESPVERVLMLELFTSHGCSSCPPADAWLRELKRHPGLWREIIPLALHVDYWDWLGWKDRFSDPRYSRRQRDYQRVGAVRAVYTPGFVLDGHEWKGWFRNRPLDPEPGPEAGRLRLDLEQAGGTVRVTFTPSGGEPDAPLAAHVAVLGFGLSSPVGGGENRGRTLGEDFVVLGWSEAEAPAGKREWRLPWPRTVEAETTRRALVAWISAPGNPRPLQAVAGWLP